MLAAGEGDDTGLFCQALSGSPMVLHGKNTFKSHLYVINSAFV